MVDDKHSAQSELTWTSYFDNVRGQPARETLVLALDRFDAETASLGLRTGGVRRVAVDLGAGEGRDTRELLRRGWSVIAIDSSEEGIRRLLDSVDVEHMDRVEARVLAFEAAAWPAVDLVNASFSIPHCAPSAFAGLWAKIAASIRPGGRFAGQFFGVHDEWAAKPDGITRTFHTRADVERMLREGGLVAEHLDEQDRMGKKAGGTPKHWHVFHVVARKVGTLEGGTGRG